MKNYILANCDQVQIIYSKINYLESKVPKIIKSEVEFLDTNKS